MSTYAGGTTWGYWVDNGTASTSTSTWTSWASTTDSTTASITMEPWHQWIGSQPIYTYSTTTQDWVVWGEQVERAKLTKAERKKAAAVELERRRVYAEQQRLAAERVKEAEIKRKAAHDRAEVLLLSHLTKEQEKAWKEERAIFVTSQSGRRFKIKDGRAHNIFELDKAGKPIKEYCVHVQPACPNQDNVLAQKLALEHNEAGLLRLANVRDL